MLDSFYRFFLIAFVLLTLLITIFFFLFYHNHPPLSKQISTSFMILALFGLHQVTHELIPISERELRQPLALQVITKGLISVHHKELSLLQLLMEVFLLPIFSVAVAIPLL